MMNKVIEKVSSVNLSSHMLLLLSSIYIVVFGNFTFWSKLNSSLGDSTYYHLFILNAFFYLFVTVVYFTMSMISFSWVVKHTVAVFIIATSIISYFIDSYGSIVSVSMIQNVIETDVNEATDLLSFGLIRHVFVLGVLPCLFVYWVKIKHRPFVKESFSRILSSFLMISVTSSVIYFSYKNLTFVGRENRDLRVYMNPLFPISSAYKHVMNYAGDKDHTLIDVFSDAKSISSNTTSAPTVLVIVVGETARASSFGINGYIKDTTPFLNKENIINYNNSFSCGTATAESIPCMFSDVTHDDFDLDEIRSRENVLDALKYANVDVLWRENNSGCKGVCERVETERMSILTSNEFCKGDECFDESLLINLDERLSNINKNTVIVMHQQGSHGPAYYKRTPEEFIKFKPQCMQKDVHECTQEEVINSYDNTILYTDYVLSKIIAALKKHENHLNPAMIYMSDHGESLGENGIYLHGLPYFMAPDEQIHIPFVVWLSKSISANKSIDSACLRENSESRHSHDNLVHSVLGLMDINTQTYSNEHDVFSSCRLKIVNKDDPSKNNKKSIKS